MIDKKSRIFLEDQENDFFYKKSKSNLNITFNRISFIFFIFFIICIIYSIHLIHLGSRKANIEINNIKQPLSSLSRADILDRHGRYIVKTVSSIDIGISSKKVIDKKKLILNLKYIFPNKDYKKIESQLKNKNGIQIVNDVSGLNYDSKTKNILKKYKTPFVIQHSQGIPENMQNNPNYKKITLIYKFSNLHLFYTWTISNY